jgi:hypothetical protein
VAGFHWIKCGVARRSGVVGALGRAGADGPAGQDPAYRDWDEAAGLLRRATGDAAGRRFPT